MFTSIGGAYVSSFSTFGGDHASSFNRVGGVQVRFDRIGGDHASSFTAISSVDMFDSDETLDPFDATGQFAITSSDGVRKFDFDICLSFDLTYIWSCVSAISNK